MRALLSSLMLFLAFLAPVAGAESARWDPPGGTLPVGQATALQLVLENCDAKDTPVPPKVEGLALAYTGQSSSMSWVNGSFSRSVTYNYSALLSRSQAVEIPSFEIETGKGKVRVPAARFDPTGATVGSGGPSLESAASSRIIPSTASVWVGQIFDLNYRIQAGQSYVPEFGPGFDWKPDPLTAEDWSQPSSFTVTPDSGTEVGRAYRTRAIAGKPGRIRINPASQLVNLSIGVVGLGFFPQRQYQQFSVTSNSPIIDVQPLPPAPVGFTGAVGDFKLSSKVVPDSARVGDPITWTLELTGTGNWPAIAGLPPRDVSGDFQVIQPKPKRTSAAGKLFEATLAEDAVLIPTRAGTYQLGPVSFVYFDPQEGTYKTISTPGTTVTIAPAAVAPSLVPAATAAQPTSPPPAIRLPAVQPPEPSGIPRDDLPDSGPGPAPLSSGELASLLLAPVAVFIVLWLWQALRRAKKTDPQRVRREAHSRLSETVARIRSSGHDTPSGESLLADWMRDAAILWEIEHAAPSVGVFTEKAASLPAMEAWASLWDEAERAVYGPHRSLPDDWTSRAEAALVAKPAPRFTRSQLFLPRNLFPWLYVVVLVAAGLAAPDRAVADEGGSAYRKGDFAAAETAWRAVVASHPTDWSARHNLSLALAQQNRWSEAAAQATAAFVQQPSSEQVRWQFALACEKSEVAPTGLGAFLAPGPVQHLARLASPATWQQALVVAAWIAAAALGFLLVRRYQAKGGGWAERAAFGGLALGGVLAAVSLAGWLAYGPAADSRAVVTWREATLCSIPTEADTSQKTSPLPAGSVALEDKAFLGWVRLSFENGQTGWVRREETVPLWN